MPKYLDTQYVIEIPTEIEPLLEIRSWMTISQDECGPLGCFRDISNNNIDLVNKFVSKVGYSEPDDTIDDDEPTADQIHKAIEKSIDNTVHPPLVIKDNKNRTRRKFAKRRIQS